MGNPIDGLISGGPHTTFKLGSVLRGGRNRIDVLPRLPVLEYMHFRAKTDLQQIQSIGYHLFAYNLAYGPMAVARGPGPWTDLPMAPAFSSSPTPITAPVWWRRLVFGLSTRV